MADAKHTYYRSTIAGLAVVVGDPEGDDVAPKMVRFTPIHQRWDGDMLRFGYLKTDNTVAIAKLAEDSSVEEISKEEYDTVLKKADDPSDKTAFRGTL